MARKNVYKINGKVVNDESIFGNDEVVFDEERLFEEDEEIKNLLTGEAASEDSEHIEDLEYDEDDDFEYEEDDEEVDGEEVVEKKKKHKKTRKEKFHYHGKHELLPERENWKQIRFYRRRAIPLAASLITGILALVFGFISFKYNALFSLATILIVVTGLVYSLIGFFKVRTRGIIVLIIGIVFNIIGIIMVISPLKALFREMDALKDAFKGFLDTLK